MAVISRTYKELSIHAPREGGDDTLDALLTFDAGLSIHAPREGGDDIVIAVDGQQSPFNPRPP